MRPERESLWSWVDPATGIYYGQRDGITYFTNPHTAMEADRDPAMRRDMAVMIARAREML